MAERIINLRLRNQSIQETVPSVINWGLPDGGEDVLWFRDVEAAHANLGEFDPGSAASALALGAHALAYGALKLLIGFFRDFTSFAFGHDTFAHVAGSAFVEGEGEHRASLLSVVCLFGDLPQVLFSLLGGRYGPYSEFVDGKSLAELGFDFSEHVSLL